MRRLRQRGHLPYKEGGDRERRLGQRGHLRAADEDTETRRASEVAGAGRPDPIVLTQWLIQLNTNPATFSSPAKVCIAEVSHLIHTRGLFIHEFGEWGSLGVSRLRGKRPPS